MSFESDNFESILVKTDVTALKIVKDVYLFTGIGNVLSLYNVQVRKLLAQKPIFIGQKIHGIVSSTKENKVMIYGGKLICLLSYKIKNDCAILQSKFKIKINDWILTLIWIENDTKIAILTAHNVVQIWNVITAEMLDSYECDERCILYSGFLYAMDSSVLVMAGTVFSQVILWKTGYKSILHNLIGHKGVIFSISYSERENIIATTSDDRSVRIWKINNLKETLNNPQLLDYWKNVQISSEIAMFGHTARVMRNVIVDKNVISIGEDSLICIWDFEGKLINKHRARQDGSLWCIDYNIKNDLLITGGGDSGVLLIRLSNCLKYHEHKIKTLTFMNDQIVPKKISFTYRGNVICLTEQGNLLYYDFETEEWFGKEIATKYSNMSISKCRQYIILSNMIGDVKVLAETCKFDPILIECIDQKLSTNGLLSVHWLEDRNIVTCDRRGVIQVWHSRGDRIVELHQFNLPMCKERWLTVAAYLCKPRYLLIVGDRCGNVHVFNQASADPIQTISKVHGRLGSNSIEIDNDKIITTGRDGTIKYFKLFDSKLQFLHSKKLTFNWVERVLEKNTIVCGFRESSFVFTKVKDCQNIFEINCGGGHRSWYIKKKWCKVDDDLKSYYQFAFIKNSAIHSVDVMHEDAPVNLIDGFHIKEINALLTLRLDLDNHIFISAGEDTTIRFNRYYKNNEIKFDDLCNVSKHLSSVRCMSVLTLKDRYLLFSAGGRAQICAWDISIPKDGSNTLDCKEIDNYLLKGSDLQRKGRIGWQQVEKDMDAETRIMSIASLLYDSSVFILTGCSDTFLRIFSLNNDKLELKASLKYHSKCILKVHYIIFDTKLIIMTMYTDGFIAFWNWVNDIEPFHEIKLHKAGINCFDVKMLNDSTYLILTGGDDNDLQLNVIMLEIDVDDKVDLSHLCKWHCDKHHCAQITGVQFLKYNFIICTSIDQRITILKWHYDYLIHCEFVDQYHVNVSDVQGLSLLDNERDQIVGCVYGKGMEIFRINFTN